MTMSQTKKAKAIRWFARQPEATQIEALKFQTDLIRQAKGRGEKHTPELTLSSLADACMQMIYTEESISKKGTAKPEEMRFIHDRRIARVRGIPRPGRPSKKFDEIRVRFYHVIKELRATEKFGWRNAARYLLEVHKYKISHNRLREIIEALDEVFAAGVVPENQNRKEE